MGLTKVTGSGANGLTLSSTDITIASGDLLFGTSAKGVNLGVTSNTDSNTLDDYEEGTYDVVFTPRTSGSITMRSDYNTGGYIKVGKLVHVSFYAVISAISSPTGYLKISLPFAVEVGSEGAHSSAFYVHGGGFSGLNVVNIGGGIAVNNTSDINVHALDGTSLQLDVSEALTSSSYFYGGGTYRTS